MSAIASSEVSTAVPLLASAAARSLIVAGIAALLLAGLRVRATSIRLFAWTSVLYVALAMPALQLLVPPLSVTVPGLPGAMLRSNVAPAASMLSSAPRAEVRMPAFRSGRAQGSAVASLPTVATEANSLPSAGFHWPQFGWGVLAAVAYLAVTVILLARILVGLFFERRLRLASRPITEDRILRDLARSARLHGLRSVPGPAESEWVSVPLTLGILRPMLLFPAGWREWDDVRLQAVIAHEMSHVARRDSLTRLLSILHRALFWFSPLAWWLDRHLADLAECASDESALACGVDRAAYARTLLNFFASLEGVRGRVRWQGISMASAGRAEQRVERILTWKGNVTMRLKTSLAVLVILLALPVVYLTASAQPAAPQSASAVELAQNAATAAPSAPAAAPARHARRSSLTTGTGRSYAYGFDDHLSYVIVNGSDDSLTISGMGIDSEHVRDLKARIGRDFIWFRRDGKAYVIRDQATVQRALSFWAGHRELGAKQEELGRQQEELGRQQEALSGQMDQERVTLPDLSKDLERLQARLKELGSGATQEQIGDLQSQIGAMQEKVGEAQSHAGDRQSELGEKMGALGEKQGKLGEEQGKLGEQQGRIAEEANRKMKALLDEAVSKGLAQLDSSSGEL